MARPFCASLCICFPTVNPTAIVEFFKSISHFKPEVVHDEMPMKAKLSLNSASL